MNNLTGIQAQISYALTIIILTTFTILVLSKLTNIF